MRNLRLAMIVVLVAGATIALPSPEAVAAPQVAVAAAADVEAARARILADTNAARSAAGLPLLGGDSALHDVAQGCSQTQAANNAMAHCPGFANRYPGGWTWAGENVAAGYAVESVVNGWMNSPGHRANILNPSATHIGIGFAVSASGRTYFTQNLAAYPPSVRAPGLYGHFRTAYDGVVYRVDGSGAQALTWDQYVAAGRPAFLPAPTEYVRYPWSSSISAVTTFGLPSSKWVWKYLDWAMFTQAGKPTPRFAGWIAGSTIIRYATAADLLITDPGQVTHHLTYNEWIATGYQSFRHIDNQGYMRLSWDPWGAIAFMCDVNAGRGYHVTYPQYASAGSPTPKAVTRTSGDRVWRDSGGALNYRGPITETKLTTAQWQAMGSPNPANGPGTGSYGCS